VRTNKIYSATKITVKSFKKVKLSSLTNGIVGYVTKKKTLGNLANKKRKGKIHYNE
jgi:hypothetical protein